MNITDAKSKVDERLSAIKKTDKLFLSISDLPALTIEGMVELERRKLFDHKIGKLT